MYHVCIGSNLVAGLLPGRTVYAILASMLSDSSYPIHMSPTHVIYPYDLSVFLPPPQDSDYRMVSSRMPRAARFKQQPQRGSPIHSAACRHPPP